MKTTDIYSSKYSDNKGQKISKPNYLVVLSSKNEPNQSALASRAELIKDFVH
jgi:hypothetical protein